MKNNGVEKTEIASYYLRLADEYRQRYLDAEKLIGEIRDQGKREVETAVKQTEQRLNKIIEEERDQHLSRIQEKDREISRLQQLINDFDSKQLADQLVISEIHTAQEALHDEYTTLRDSLT